MRRRALWAMVLAALLLTGCWDKLEMEDQIFAITLAVDPGERSRYRVTIRVPVVAQMRAGILGGVQQGGQPVDLLTAEADTLAQAIYILNASAARRITLRHLRGIVIGEDLARAGLYDLLAELMRNGEVRTTAGVYIAHGSATETLLRSRPTGEFNPGKINEGLLLVEKSLHMAPPIRLHHLINRNSLAGIDPFAPIVGLNRRITGEGEERRETESAIAGQLDRMGKNPMEIAGTAVFRDTRLAGFLTVDETQALLALRGEMGKAYVTLPDPINPARKMIIRFQQENKPRFRTAFGTGGPRVTVHLLFEGEVLSGSADYRDPLQRRQVEQAAARYMQEQLDTVLSKLVKWGADPVGFGLHFRSRFASWDDWRRYNWREQAGRLRVQVTLDMRLRRFGLIHTGPEIPREEG